MKTNHLILGKTKSILILVFICSFINVRLSAQDNAHYKHQQMNDSIMKRQQMIHNKSSMVMPFDMDKVTHYFINTDSGGILRIITKDPKDTVQTDLIRNHLKKEQALFSEANFKDPETLHGMTMPGLNILSEVKGKLNVEYKELPDGAQLKFTSKDSVIILAIHEWFEAQIQDHGNDAKSQMQ